MSRVHTLVQEVLPLKTESIYLIFPLCLPLHVFTVQEFCFSSWSRKTCAFYCYGNFAVIGCTDSLHRWNRLRISWHVRKRPSLGTQTYFRLSLVSAELRKRNWELPQPTSATSKFYQPNLSNTKFCFALIQILHYFIDHSSFATVLFNPLSFFPPLSRRILHTIFTELEGQTFQWCLQNISLSAVNVYLEKVIMTVARGDVFKWCYFCWSLLLLNGGTRLTAL